MSYYKKIFFLLLAVLFSYTASAQSRRDSLENKLKSASGKEKLAILDKLIGITRRPEPNKAKEYFDDFEKTYFGLSEPEDFSALYYHIKGEVEIRDAHYRDAIRDLETSLKFAEKKKDYDMLWSSYNSLGAAYQETADLAHSLEAYLKAYKVAEEHLEEGARSGSALNLGAIYGEQHQFAEALKYFRYSLNYHAKFPDSWGLGNSLNNVGQVHMFMGRNDSALFYFNKALAVWKNISDDYGVAMTSFNIGTLDLYSKNYARADLMFQKSLEISEKISDQFGITQNLAALSTLYLEQGKEKEGLEYLQRSIEYSKKNNILSSVRDNYKTQFEYFKQKNDFKNALEAHENYFFWYDSLNNSSKAKNLQELQSKFETEKKEKQIIKQLAEIDKQRTQRSFLIGGMILVLLFLLYVFRSYRQKKKAHIEITKQKALIEEKQREILDSIHYAKRIQQSLLPNEKVIERLLKQLRHN